jgi:hypothetical protein
LRTLNPFFLAAIPASTLRISSHRPTLADEDRAATRKSAAGTKNRKEQLFYKDVPSRIDL